VNLPEEAAQIINEWLKEYGKNVSDSKVDCVFECKGKYCVYISYRNWLEGEDAEEIDLALENKSSCLKKRKKLRLVSS